MLKAGLTCLQSLPAQPNILVSWRMTTGKSEARWWPLQPQSHPTVQMPAPRGPSPASTNLSARGPCRPPGWPVSPPTHPPCLEFLSGVWPGTLFPLPFQGAIPRRHLLCTSCVQMLCTLKYPLLSEVRVNTSYPWVKKVPESLANTPEVTQPVSASSRNGPSSRSPVPLPPQDLPPPLCLRWPECVCVCAGGRGRCYIR